MANFFKNTAQTPVVPQRQALEQKYNSSRSNLLLVVAFTVVNIILLVTNSNSYFLFSAFIPYNVVDWGMYLCGKYPAEYYEDIVNPEFLDNTFFAIAIAIAVVIILFYLLSWIFSKKRRVGWLIAAAAFFVLDTVGMLWLLGFSTDIIIDIVFHVWVIFSLINGIAAHYKLKKLPEEEPLLIETDMVQELSDPISEEGIVDDIEEDAEEDPSMV